MICRICKGTDLEKFLDLGHHPPSDAFLTEEQLREPETHYPLDVWVCKTCGLVQLGYVVPKEVLFNHEYPYTTGSNTEGIEHFRNFAFHVARWWKLTKNDLVVDIGSNDGTLLQGFKNLGCRVLGVEPCYKIGLKAVVNGINTFPGFFNEFIGGGLAYDHGKAKIITATNVFAHVDDLHEFMKAVDILLAPDGIFIIEAPHLSELIKNLAYDTIYHEHLSYLHHYPIDYLASKFGMELFDAEAYPVHGGTVRYYLRRGTHGTPHMNDPYIPALHQFAQQVVNHKHSLYHKLSLIRQSGYSIVGVSAPAKGNTLLNYCNIGPDILDYLTEVSEHKIGKYSPGMHIPVVPDDRLIEDQPHYALILAWNWKEAIMTSLRKKGYRGKFIIPLPEPYVYDTSKTL